MPRTKTYEMTVTVTVALPDGYQEHVDEYRESEMEHACYSAVHQNVNVLGLNSPTEQGPRSKWLDVWAECEKPMLIEESDR